MLGLISLTFCFQEESVSFLSSSLDSKRLACKRINRGFLLTGVILVGTVVFGGISFVHDQGSKTEKKGIDAFSISDYFIGSYDVDRLIFCGLIFLQMMPMVPMLALKSASYIWKIADDEDSQSTLIIRILAIILSALMSWIFFIPRAATYSMLSISGGFIGFVFIFLVPILMHWRSNDTTIKLEDRLNRESKNTNQGLKANFEFDIEQDNFIESTLSTAGLIAFAIVGLTCLTLPILASMGYFSGE